MKTIALNNQSMATVDAVWAELMHAMKSHWNKHLDFSKPAWVITYNQDAETFDNMKSALERMHDLTSYGDCDCAMSIGGRNEDGEIEQCDGDPIFITENTPEPQTASAED